MRLTHERIKVNLVGDMFQSYFVWVPLGPIAAGSYTLELYDNDRKDVLLTRRTFVNP